VAGNGGFVSGNQLLDDGHCAGNACGVGEAGLHGEQCLLVAEAAGGGVHAPGGDMDGMGKNKPHIAVYPRPGVPAGVGRFGMVDTHGKGIRFTRFDVGGEVMEHRHIAVGAHPQGDAIDKNLPVAVYPFEVDIYLFTFLLFRNLQFSPVPGDPSRKITGSAGQRGGVWPLDAPVVGHVDRTPPGIVIIRRRRFLEIPFLKFPALIDFLGFSEGNLPRHLIYEQAGKKNQGKQCSHFFVFVRWSVQFSFYLSFCIVYSFRYRFESP